MKRNQHICGSLLTQLPVCHNLPKYAIMLSCNQNNFFRLLDFTAANYTNMRRTIVSLNYVRCEILSSFATDSYDKVQGKNKAQ